MEYVRAARISGYVSFPEGEGNKSRKVEAEAEAGIESFVKITTSEWRSAAALLQLELHGYYGDAKLSKHDLSAVHLKISLYLNKDI